MVGIDAGPWEPCRQVGGRSRHVFVLHDVNIGTHMLSIGITLKRGVIYFCHEAKPRGRNISTRVFV